MKALFIGLLLLAGYTAGCVSHEGSTSPISSARGKQSPHKAQIKTSRPTSADDENVLPDGSLRPKPVPANAKELNRIASVSATGAWGDGLGLVVVHTPAGDINAGHGLALGPVYVFGEKVEKQTLVQLLQARIDAPRSGSTPMSGNVAPLIITVLMLMDEVATQEDISLLSKLLEDKAPRIRGFTARTLLKIGNRNPAYRKTVMTHRKKIRANMIENKQRLKTIFKGACCTNRSDLN